MLVVKVHEGDEVLTFNVSSPGLMKGDPSLGEFVRWWAELFPHQREGLKSTRCLVKAVSWRWRMTLNNSKSSDESAFFLQSSSQALWFQIRDGRCLLVLG